jgi:hypothetical protein
MMMTNRWLFVYVLLFALFFWTPAEVSGQTGYSRLGTTVLVDTNGVVSQPSSFWLNNVVAAGDIVADLDSLGRLRLFLQVDTNTALSVYWDALLDTPAPIMDIADGLRVPLMRSSTFEAWTDAGGTLTNEGVIVTSPLLTNGVAAVDYDTIGMIPVIVQMSPDGSVWSDLAATNTAMMVRLLATNTLPAPGEATVTVSNIVATSWTHPALFGTRNDTAGQVVLVDDPAEARAAVNLATMQAAVAASAAAVNPAQWAAYPASETVRADRIVLGGAWAVEATAGGLVISGGGINLLTFADADGTETGLNIAAMTLDGLVATIDISTNGVAGRPLAQWSASLMVQDWQTLTPTSETYPELETNGYYRIVATLPADSGFVRAVYDAGEASASVRAHVLPAASGLYDLGSAAAPWRAAYLDTLIVGGTNVMTELAGKQPAGSYVTPADTNGWEVGSHAGFVTTADLAYIAAITNLTAGAGISITGSGRTRTIASTITQYADSNAVAAIKADADWTPADWDFSPTDLATDYPTDYSNLWDAVSTPQALTITGGTATVTRTLPVVLSLEPGTNAVYITADVASYPTNGVATHLLSLAMGTGLLTWNTNVFTGAGVTTSVTNGTLISYTLHKPWRGTKFEVLAGGAQ